MLILKLITMKAARDARGLAIDAISEVSSIPSIISSVQKQKCEFGGVPG
jgi:hypothetical protein